MSGNNISPPGEEGEKITDKFMDFSPRDLKLAHQIRVDFVLGSRTLKGLFYAITEVLLHYTFEPGQERDLFGKIYLIIKEIPQKEVDDTLIYTFFQVVQKFGSPTKEQYQIQQEFYKKMLIFVGRQDISEIVVECIPTNIENPVEFTIYRLIDDKLTPSGTMNLLTKRVY